MNTETDLDVEAEMSALLRSVTDTARELDANIAEKSFSTSFDKRFETMGRMLVCLSMCAAAAGREHFATDFTFRHFEEFKEDMKMELLEIKLRRD